MEYRGRIRTKANINSRNQTQGQNSIKDVRRESIVAIVMLTRTQLGLLREEGQQQHV